MKRDDSVYLRHVLDAIAKIETYLRDVDEQTFLNQSLLQDGAIRQIEIIGEAVKQLSSGLREQHPQLPWQDIAGMRDKLIHQYFGVDLDKVWVTVVRDIPVLKQEVTEILSNLTS
ncbi:MAG: hypothetical protein JMDDDDMK_05363 [Acidobacteria bacterium]|nr:hypothetical protein [Acidobacteriota bacterium]